MAETDRHRPRDPLLAVVVLAVGGCFPLRVPAVRPDPEGPRLRANNAVPATTRSRPARRFGLDGPSSTDSHESRPVRQIAEDVGQRSDVDHPRPDRARTRRGPADPRSPATPTSTSPVTSRTSPGENRINAAFNNGPAAVRSDHRTGVPHPDQRLRRGELPRLPGNGRRGRRHQLDFTYPVRDAYSQPEHHPDRVPARPGRPGVSRSCEAATSTTTRTARGRPTSTRTGAGSNVKTPSSGRCCQSSATDRDRARWG